MISPTQELKESRNHLIHLFSEGKAPEAFEENFAEMTDQYFRNGLQESRVGNALFKAKTPFAFVALGGYGRSELCIHSDIDVMILFGRKIPAQAKELTQEILFPLWDLGLDLGYGIRTVKDCLDLSADDFEFMTSILDARFICGDSPLFLSLMDSFQKKVTSKKATGLNRWLMEQEEIRMSNFGDASYLLEPNLKEGIGSLRDYHQILWLARVFLNLRTPRDLEYFGTFSYKEFQDLKDNLRFILFVRNHLHQISGRKNDQLIFEYQEMIARRLGFDDRKDYLAVEQFMGKLHAAMTSIKSLHRSFLTGHLLKMQDKEKDVPAQEVAGGLHLYRGELNFNSATAILSNPMIMLEIFETGASNGLSLSLEARRLVREFLYLIDDPFRRSEEASRRFLYILNLPNAFDVLDQMYETGFLGAFIPEFELIRNRVQFDRYHIFPVDRHLLQTFRYLKTIAEKKELLLLDILSEIPKPEPLLIAALFHDLGKTGKNHAARGVKIARNILNRFQYEKEATEDILFLIGHHLLLVETATRRDLNDEKAVIQCARMIGNPDRLKMLYLLTWSDSNATGPRAWNEWTANLVQELFFKILHILKKGELAAPSTSRKVEATLSRLRRELAGEMEEKGLEALFEVMSPRYVLETNSKLILHHIGLYQTLPRPCEQRKGSAFILEAKEDESADCWEVTFLAADRPGLFSDFAGVMALNNINILSAHIYTWLDETAVDLFKVTRPLDPVHAEEIWEKIRKDLKGTFTGRLSLVYRLSEKAKSSLLSPKNHPTRPPKVIVDNESSDFFSLIEVFADDHVGLLYQITHILFGLRLDIRIAKIATKGDQIADVFYVRDLDGQKVEDEKQVIEIREALLHQLNKGF
jgi:[protein-PII] uridylyltransferase